VLILRSLSFFLQSSPIPTLSPLSLHDALPIFLSLPQGTVPPRMLRGLKRPRVSLPFSPPQTRGVAAARATSRSTPVRPSSARRRSEEHTSELQSHLNLVCRLLLEKKKIKNINN